MKNEIIDTAVEEIESAANGISGAAALGDVAYAQKRRADIGFAAERLRGQGAPIAVDTLLAKADKLLAACRAKDLPSAVQLNIEIGNILAPLCD